MDLSPKIEDYLKSVYLLQARHPQVSTTALAERLGVSAPSVSAMVRKLAHHGLLEHQPYKGVRLTARGEAVALKIIRAHRLWELYLVEELGFAWDQAHVEAEQLEHAVSQQLTDRLDQVLDHPTTDPHGHPIPNRNGQMPTSAGLPVTQLRPDETATVLQIRDDTPELLRYLGNLGVYPGERITVLEVAPFNGPIHIQVSQATRVLGREVAEHVMVRTEARSRA
jgi:DtxR family Mn-dependent transcriptional regulator